MSREQPYLLDCHVDTLLHVLDGGADLHQGIPQGHVDLDRLEAGGVRILFFALWPSLDYVPEGSFERTIALDEPCNTLLAWGDAVAVFCGKALWRVNPRNGEVARVCDLPGEVHTATISPTGELYFACGTMLYRLDV